MEVDSDVMYTFKKQIKKIQKFRGSGTEMISIYIPKDYAIHEMSNKLREEMSQASNIKSKQTRTNVTTALEKIIHHLKMFKTTLSNGLCVFCGDIADDPSKTDIQIFSIEPPFPLKINIYRCDSSFFLEPLVGMMESKDSYGIVVLDGREATVAIVKGTETHILKRINSMVHSKIRKGGQSSARFQRLREEGIEKFYKRVGEAMDQHFLDKELKGVVIGGPGPTKEFFEKAKKFNYQIKILGVVDTGYTDEYGIREVLAKSGDLLLEQESVKERKIVERFIKEVSSDGLATYGLSEVEAVIKNHQSDEILVSEDLRLRKIILKCSSCGSEEEHVVGEHKGIDERCSKCNGIATKELDEELADYLVELAKENGIKVMIISTSTAEGSQFLQGFGGIGAFLRYK